MIPSQKAYELIKQFEGLRLIAYKPIPSEKYYTIGYGHCSKDIKRGQAISKDLAEKLLYDDVRKYSYRLAELLPQLRQNEYDALISFIYNVGWYGFRYSMTFQTLKDMPKSRTPIDCARRLILWTKANGITLLGLQKRRIMEANYFMGYEAFILKDNQIIERNI